MSAAAASSLAGTGPHPENWRDYWSRDTLWRESALGEISAGILLRRAGEILPFGRADSVLEIGCGPGHLAKLLAPRVEGVRAFDVAPACVESCRERCRSLANVSVGLLGSDYTDLTDCGGPFTRILCVSVVQYYRDVTEVERLIHSACAIAAPGAAMLIADLPLERTPAEFVRDALGTLSGALRGGYLRPLLKAARGRWGTGSSYRACQSRAGSLVFNPTVLEALVRKTGLRATLLRESLSIYANRPSLLLGF